MHIFRNIPQRTRLNPSKKLSGMKSRAWLTCFKKGFGLLPKMLIWGVLGVVIASAMTIFKTGTVKLLDGGFHLNGKASEWFAGDLSWGKAFVALCVSVLMNTLFAPVFMTFHKITDIHIAETGGTLKGFFSTDENLSGVFNWCLEGCRKFYAEGMEEPNAVKEAVREYQVESDRIGQFIEAWIEEGESYEVLSSAVFRKYTDWCKEYNYNAENAKNFKTAMEQRFTYVRRRPKSGGEKTTLLLGCKLRAEELGAETPDSAALSNDFVPLDDPTPPVSSESDPDSLSTE